MQLLVWQLSTLETFDHGFPLACSVFFVVHDRGLTENALDRMMLFNASQTETQTLVFVTQASVIDT